MGNVTCPPGSTLTGSRGDVAVDRPGDLDERGGIALGIRSGHASVPDSTNSTPSSRTRTPTTPVSLDAGGRTKAVFSGIAPVRIAARRSEVTGMRDAAPSARSLAAFDNLAASGQAPNARAAHRAIDSASRGPPSAIAFHGWTKRFLDLFCVTALEREPAHAFLEHDRWRLRSVKAGSKIPHARGEHPVVHQAFLKDERDLWAEHESAGAA